MTDLDDRLENWGRAYRLHRVGCRIMSVWRWARSGRFSASPDAPSRILDMADAELVQAAIRTLVPWRLRFVALHYAIQLHPGKVCYLVNRMDDPPPMRLRLAIYETVMQDCHQMIAEALDKRQGNPTIAITIRLHSPVRCGGVLGADARPEAPPKLCEAL